MELNAKQKKLKEKIQEIAVFFGLDPNWLLGVAMTESSMGLHQKSRTGARGVFQMTRIAMQDLLQEMENYDDDLIDVAIGAAFLYLLKRRWLSEEAATEHYCDPADRHFYIGRVMEFKRKFGEGAS